MHQLPIRDRLFQTLSKVVACGERNTGSDSDVVLIMSAVSGLQPRSMRAVESDMRVWLKWWASSAQMWPPGSGQSVGVFIDHLRSRDRMVSTVSRALFSVGRVFSSLGWLDEEAVALISQVRKLGDDACSARRWCPPRRMAFTLEMVRRCLKVVRKEDELEVRCAAALLVLYDTMECVDQIFGYRSGSEWHIEPLKRSDVARRPEGGGILVLANGVDGTRERTALLSEMTMAWLDRLHEHRTGSDGALFTTARGNPWSQSHWHAIVRRILTRAGFAPDSFSSVSLRLGAAKDLLDSGVSPLDICRRNEWRDTTRILRLMEQSDRSSQGRPRRRSGVDNPRMTEHQQRTKWGVDGARFRGGSDSGMKQEQLPLPFFMDAA